MLTEQTLARFDAKTTRDHDESFDGIKCVLWTASHANKSGYGRFWDGERHRVAHHVAWEREHGPVPDGMMVGHRCRNKLCVEHLELITLDEMIARRVAAFTPATHHRCCGRERNADNTWPCGRCIECNRKATVRWRRKPAVRAKIRAEQKVYRERRRANQHL